MGDKGALVINDAGVYEIPSVPVDVVDTTGAGDAFNSGLAVALAEGKDLIEAVKFAVCAGGIACTKLGVIPSFGDREAVDKVFAENFAEGA
jgi:ribokinase